MSSQFDTVNIESLSIGQSELHYHLFCCLLFLKTVENPSEHKMEPVLRIELRLLVYQTNVMPLY